MADGSSLNKSELWEEYYINLHRAYNSLRQTFKSSGMTQDQLAVRLDTDKGLISKRLNGKENLTLKTISFMASALNCRLSIDFIPYENVASATAEPTINTADKASAYPTPSVRIAISSSTIERELQAA